MEKKLLEEPDEPEFTRLIKGPIAPSTAVIIKSYLYLLFGIIPIAVIHFTLTLVIFVTALPLVIFIVGLALLHFNVFLHDFVLFHHARLVMAIVPAVHPELYRWTFYRQQYAIFNNDYLKFEGIIGQSMDIVFFAVIYVIIAVVSFVIGLGCFLATVLSFGFFARPAADRAVTQVVYQLEVFNERYCKMTQGPNNPYNMTGSG